MPTTGIAEIAATENVSATGNDSVDALLSGVAWAPDPGSETTTISYSFSTPDSVYHFDIVTGYETGDNFNEPTFDMSALTAYAQGLFQNGLANIERFTNLDFVQVEDTPTTAGTIRVAWSAITDEDAVAWAYLPSGWVGGGDIWLIAANHDEDDLDFFHTLIHELGHALGLKHSFEAEGAFPALDSQYEGVDYTVMSYTVSARFPDATWSDLWPQSYMYFDILALQEMYGVDTVTTAGTDTYDFDQSARHYLTVWDYGGTDSIGASNGNTAVDINLTPGTWINVGTTIGYWDGTSWTYDNYSVYIADDTTIENAYGAGGADTLTGNDVGNRLTGNAGNDKLFGGLGADRLLGGADDDSLEGGDGADTLRGDAGTDIGYGADGNDELWAGGTDDAADTFIGGAGNDVMGGGAGGDLLVGGGVNEGATLHLLSENGDAADDGVDTLYGGDGDDTLLGGGWDESAGTDNGTFDAGEEVTSGTEGNVAWAGTGADLVYGAAGADTMGGGSGDDSVNGEGGNDTIYGGSGDGADTGVNDVLDGGSGDDVIFAGGGNDSLIGGDGADDLYSGGGDDTVDGGAGDDTLWGGGGDDRFTGGDGADTFVFASGHGDDTVTDFSVSDDELRLVNTATDFVTAADVEAAATEQNGGLLIDLGGGDSLFLAGLSVSDIASMNLVLEAS